MQNTRWVFLLLFTLLTSCGRKTPLDTFPPPPARPEDEILYVWQSPAWTASSIGGFNAPTDIIAGYDEMIYVLDSGNNRIVQLNQLGEVVSASPPVLRANALTHTRSQQLLVAATIDTLIIFPDSLGGTRQMTVPVIYRFNLPSSGGRLAGSVPERIYTYPVFFINKRDTTLIRSGLKFGGITARADNGFYAALTTVDEAIDYGTDIHRFLLFPSIGATPIPITVWEGISSVPTFNPNLSAAGTTSLFSAAMPPQSQTVDPSFDFCMSSASPDPNTRWRVRRIIYVAGQQRFYVDGTLILREATAGQFKQLGEPDRFRRPADVCYDAARQFIYVVDTQSDSLHIFSADLVGIEAVVTRPLSGILYTPVSFSAFNNGQDRLKDPSGVCTLRDVVYVSDTGNNRVLRFKLSVDIR